MSSNVKIPEWVYATNQSAPELSVHQNPYSNVLEELSFLSSADCDFLVNIFQRFPKVRDGFNHMLGFEPEERVAAAVEKLKREPRAAWPVMGVPEMIQSVAGHQAHGMKISFLLAAGTHNPERIARMMAVHDLSESVTGDFISGGAYKDDITKPERQKLERIVMHFLLQDFPDEEAAAEMRALWEEYEEGITPDSIMAHDIDKLELVMQAQYYESIYPDLNKPFKELWDHARNNIKTPQAKALLTEITAHHPRPHPLKTQHGQVFTFPWPL